MSKLEKRSTRYPTFNERTNRPPPLPPPPPSPSPFFFGLFFFFLCSGGQVQVRDERVRQGVPTGEDVRRGGALQCQRRPASGAVLRCQISPRPPTPQGLTVPAQSALAHATVCLRQYCTAYNTGTGTEYWHSSRYWHSRILVQQYGTGPAV